MESGRNGEREKRRAIDGQCTVAPTPGKPACFLTENDMLSHVLIGAERVALRLVQLFSPSSTRIYEPSYLELSRSFLSFSSSEISGTWALAPSSSACSAARSLSIEA
jgi:hypothetical protein